MVRRETENNAYAKFGVTNKEHYGMLWYFLEWPIALPFLSSKKLKIWSFHFVVLQRRQRNVQKRGARAALLFC